MNRTILLLLMIISSWTLAIQAQVTIDQSTFPRQAEFIDSLFVDESLEMLPTEGAAQIWDYSALQEDSILVNSYTDATADTALEGALNFTNNSLVFLDSIIPRVVYEGVDEAGYYELGSAIEELVIPLRTSTGGANDSLRFLAKKAAFEGRLDYLQFPLTYEKKWEGSNIERIDLELTITDFGLDKTPGQLKRIETQKREVVGYGQLTLPQKEGPSEDSTEGLIIVDALLIKSEISFVDSFFLAGAPAATSLLAIFQLSQGVSLLASHTRYTFYIPDFGSSVLDIGFVGNDEIFFIGYRPQLIETTTSIQEVEWLSLKSFPNPVEAGTTVNIQLNDAISKGYFQLSDINGRLIQERNFNAASNSQISIPIPITTGPGLYIYQVYDEGGQAIGRGKLQVN